MPVGDASSPERGSGARYNDGKLALELLPGWALEQAFELAFDEGMIDEEVLEEASWLTALWDGTAPVDVAMERIIEGLTRDDILGAARVFKFGSEKYAPWNWAKGMPWSIPYACYMRHTILCPSYELDTESGLAHRYHAVCNLIMLAHFVQHCQDMDDRPRELTAEFHQGCRPEPVPVADAFEVTYCDNDGRLRVEPVGDMPTEYLNELVEVAVEEQESRIKTLRATGVLTKGESNE